MNDTVTRLMELTDKAIAAQDQRLGCLAQDYRQALQDELTKLFEPVAGPVATFDEVFDAIDWDLWRRQPIRELVRMIHSQTSPQLEVPLGTSVGEPVPVGEVVAYKDNNLQLKRIRGYDGAIAELPDGAKVYASPPAEHLCKWPTCQTEVYQKNLADQIAQELAGKPPAEVPLLTDREITKAWNTLHVGVVNIKNGFARAIEALERRKAGIK